MNISLNEKDAIEWIGAKPPDLTLEARIRKPAWIYTYLRKYYPDSSRPYGVNNEVYSNVSMPHVLEDLQSSLTENDFDELIYNLTNFMVYVSDPSANERKRIGGYVLLFLFFSRIRPVFSGCSYGFPRLCLFVFLIFHLEIFDFLYGLLRFNLHFHSHSLSNY